MEAPSNAVLYESWTEVPVSSDKGRKEVHYYLKRRDGSADLAVVGAEKSLRRMSYHCALRSNRSVLYRLRSRREVIDWLDSIVSESSRKSYCLVNACSGAKDADDLDIEALEGIQLQKMGQSTKEFQWLGPSWTCRKRRNHYQSFHRNGVRISMYDFVYVLAEEGKRLVAYVEDMYEDSRDSKMVVVRWFHKIDEVGIVLPHNFNDREIFFSLCLQDLSVECIDGLATVLSPQHYDKYLKVATHTRLEPFVCQEQFDNDDVKPFDITQVKGYWKQELLKYMYNISTSKYHEIPLQPDDVQKVEGTTSACDGTAIWPKKKHRRLKDDDDPSLQFPVGKIVSGVGHVDERNCQNSPGNLKTGAFTAVLWTKECQLSSYEYLKVGSQVEVLCQDSGIRGCWFRALIIKKCKDKVKVQYQDIQDAVDEAKKLEEWILASRIATPDQLGVRICGRSMIRPLPPSSKGRVQWAIDIGMVVDVWWHGGWWEGIVVKKDQDQICVYFPGENQERSFPCNDLRHSQEWLGNRWMHLKARYDLVCSIVSQTMEKQVELQSSDDNSVQSAASDGKQPRKDEAGSSDSHLDSGRLQPVLDLLRDCLLSELKWKTSRKRKRGSASSIHRFRGHNNYFKSNPEVMTSSSSERCFISAPVTIDRENCKFVGDSLFSSSVVPPIRSLVMSR